MKFTQFAPFANDHACASSRGPASRLVPNAAGRAAPGRHSVERGFAGTTRLAGTSRRMALGAALMLGIAACASPEEKLERYTESGQAFLEEKNWGKANIQFQNAVKINEDHIPALEGLVVIAEERADFRRMFGLLQRIVRLDPNNVGARIDLAKFYLLTEETGEALTTIDGALELEPENAEAIGVKSAILFRVQDRENALALAEKALAIDPSTQEAATVIATDMLAREQFDDVIQLLDRSIEANPKAAVLHILRVQTLSRQNRVEDTKAAFERLIEEFPDEPGYRRLFASDLLRKGDTAGAREQLVAVVDLLPDDIDAYVDVIRLDNRDAGKERALETFDTFIAKVPTFYELQFAKATYLRQQNENDAARNIYSQLVKLRGEDNEAVVLRAKNQLAAMAFASQDRETAERLMSEILERDERNSEALIKRASFKLIDEQPDQAIADLRLVLADNPELFQAKILTAAAYEKLGDMAAAERELSEALNLDSDNNEIAGVFAKFLMRQGDIDRAERVLSDVTAANPQSEENLRLLAAIKLQRQDWRGAEEVAKVLETVDQSDEIANRILGAAYTGLQDYTGAIEVLTAENEERPLSTRPLATLVNAYLETGRPSEAETVLTNAIAANPGNYDARLLLVRVLTSQNRHDEARNELRQAIETDPQRAEAYEVLYRAYRRAGQTDEAEKLLTDGIARAPDSDGLKVLRADLHIAGGEMREALNIYEDILKRRPNDQIVANNYAAILTDLSDDPADLQRAAKVAETLEGTRAANFLDTLGWSKYRAGDVETGIATLRKAYDASPEATVILFHLGAALYETGKKEEGAAYLERVLRSNVAAAADKSAARALLGR